jgi:uncharacterized membrane protein YccF (DUF307 family)
VRLLLNLLWFILGGFVVALQYVLAGLLLAITIVGLPFAVQCFKLAGLAAWPFGKTVERRRDASVLSLPMNLLWIVVAGLWIFLTHLGLALASAVTIIGIPFALQHVKFAMLALTPFGHEAREA